MALNNQFGGRVTFEFADTRIPPCDADIKLDPTNMEYESKTNQDGSPAYIGKPKQFGADISLRHHKGVDWNKLIRKEGNCTIAEEENGRTHLFTKCRLVGKAEVNVTSGEVTGLRVEGPRYQRLDK